MAVTQLGTLVIKMVTAADEIGEQFVQHLVWYNKGGTGGDDLLVTDTDDNEIWADAWATDQQNSLIMPINRRTSIKVGTIDAGALYIVT